MKAVVLHSFGEPLVVEERPEPAPRGEEVLVRVRGAGVCAAMCTSPPGERRCGCRSCSGTRSRGRVRGSARCSSTPPGGCGNCRFCVAGEEQLCPAVAEAGWAHDGGFAEVLRVPAERHLFPLEGLDPVSAAPLADAGVTPYRAVRRMAALLAQVPSRS